MIKKLAPIFILLMAMAACASRTPSDARTSHLATGFFKDYGKKFPGTAFHNNPPQQVEVKRTQELQRSLSNSFIVLTLQDGQQIPIILTLLHKFPRGWRISSWEWVRQESGAGPAEASAPSEGPGSDSPQDPNQSPQ